jgi:hypothetical protein
MAQMSSRARWSQLQSVRLHNLALKWWLEVPVNRVHLSTTCIWMGIWMGCYVALHSQHPSTCGLPFAVVVVVSWEYVRKAHCMQELAALVARWNTERGQEGALLVVPWFEDPRLPFEECARLRATYDSDTEWPSTETKPPPATLDAYAKTVQDFCQIVALRGDKVRDPCACLACMDG